MADSFRAIAASKRLAAAALEARFDHLTSGPPSPRKPKPRNLTKREQRDQDFRIACGAYVKGAQKAGAKLYADIQAAEKLLEKGQDGRGGDREKLLNSADGDGWTALHWAAAEGHLPMVRWLVQRPGLNLDAVDADGCTPLWAAAYNGEYHCALWILSKGPNLELRGKASNTASCTPCNAARSQRNPTIADAIDAELELRRQDPKRVASLKSGNIDYEDFREDLRSISKNR